MRKIICLALSISAWAQISIPTRQYDNSRTNSNLNETILTTSNVNATGFGKLFVRPVDGIMYAEPLYLPNVTIPGKGIHNVVYCATMHNSVFAFDADDPAAWAPLWKVNLGTSVTGLASALIQPEFGILSTPVIDPLSGTIYVVSRSVVGPNQTQIRLHALEVATGAPKYNSPVVIQGFVSGSTSADDRDANGNIFLDGDSAYQRVALTLANGSIYLGLNANINTSHGWILRYGATDLQLQGIFNTTLNGSNGGVWQMGRGAAVDGSGNVYFVSADGTFDGLTNFGQSFLKFGPNGLAIADWFTPADHMSTTADDLDLGLNGPILVPGTNLVLSGGKNGVVFVVDRTAMGHLQGSSAPVQSFQASPYCGSPDCYHQEALWARSSTPILYIWRTNDSIRGYRLINGLFETVPFSMGSAAAVKPGGGMTITSNGDTPNTGIIWTTGAIDNGSDPLRVPTPMVVRAYDALNLTHELWNSTMNSARDNPGNYAKYTTAVIANGKVYVPTFSNQLVVYGLLSGNEIGIPSATLSLLSLSYGNQAVGTTAVKTVTLSNFGTATLNIAGVSLTGSGDFTQTNDCPSSLAPGLSCAISVTFGPVAVATSTATVTITDNAPGSPHLLTLSGSGVLTPKVTFNPTSASFVGQVQGTSSPPTTITLSNTGNGPLNIAGIALAGNNPGDFTQTNNCPSTLSADSSCTISVVFQPSVIGSRSASLWVTDDAAGSPHKVNISGTGLGISGAAVSPASLDFNSQVIASTSAAQTITLSNTGAGTLSISGIGFTGANPGDFAQTNTCGSTLAVGASCTISVTFKPNAADTRTATLTITDTAPNSPQLVLLSGIGVAAPKAALSLASWTFANQTVGSASTAKTMTLSNTGTAAMGIASITFTGTNATDFSQTNTCPPSLAVGGNCAISVVFTPSAAGPRSAALSVYDDAAGSPHAVILNGTGVLTPKLLFSPASLTFPNTIQGTASAPMNIVLSNIGNGTLNISTIAFTGANPGEFSQTSGCPVALVAGASCTVAVVFQPPVPGSRSASLTITDDAAGSPHKATVKGTGLGIPGAELSDTSLTFAQQVIALTSVAQTVTITNTGNATLSSLAISVTGANPADFPFTKTCYSTLAVGASCSISVSFKPTAAGIRGASVLLTNSAPNSPQSVTLSGIGAAAPKAVLSATSLVFANQTVGTPSAAKSTTLSNTGSAPLNISGIAIMGANLTDYFFTTTCGTTVAVGANCAISVIFNPGAAGSSSGSLNVSSDAPGSPHNVTLSGAGVLTPKVTLSTTRLTFAGQTQGTASAVKTVSLANTGNGILTISGITIVGANAADFSQTNNCGGTLASGGSCTISATFQPGVTGSRTASISIADNAIWSPHVVQMTGTGLGIPTATFNPATLDFGTVGVGITTAAKTITLTNQGTGALTLTSILVTGTNAADFPMTKTCGSSLAAGATCNISVSFKPGAQFARVAAVTLTDNAAGSPQSIALSGWGAGQPIGPVSISGPASLLAGTVGVVYPSATITATGGTGPYIFSASGLPAGLGINASTGAITGTPTTATGSPFSVTVTATDSTSATATRIYWLTITASGGTGTTASFIMIDTTTAGTWKTVYGAGGVSINGNVANSPSYAQVAFSGQTPYMWAPTTADVRALQKFTGPDRIASTWYSATNFSIDINLTDGNTHQVAVYCLDWDGGGSRAERIEVLDAVSNAVLDTRTISGFHGGQYLVWNLKGHVKLRITRTAGANAVVSGLFFGM